MLNLLELDEREVELFTVYCLLFKQWPIQKIQKSYTENMQTHLLI